MTEPTLKHNQSQESKERYKLDESIKYNTNDKTRKNNRKIATHEKPGIR